MLPFDHIETYIQSVCEQIHWKKAHKAISDELTNHIMDQKLAFMSAGLNEKKATDMAIREMGDPVIVGIQLNHTHRPKPQSSMIILAIIILLIGFATNLFANHVLQNTPIFHYLLQSFIISLIGLTFMIIAYLNDFTIIGKYPLKMFVLINVFIFLFLPLTININGISGWFAPPFLSTFSISVFVLMLPTAYAGVIYNMKNKGHLGIIQCSAVYIFPVFLFHVSGFSKTSILIYISSCLLLLLISIFRGWFQVKCLDGILIAILPAVSSLFIIFYKIITDGTYRATLYSNFLNPYANSKNIGYLMVVIRDTLKGAKYFGQGTLPSIYTDDLSGYLPSTSTDYLITYLIHRIGWIAFIAILLVVITFITRGFYLCSKQNSLLGKLVSISVMMTFTMQIGFYLLSNLGFGLLTQPILPLISDDGITKIINLILIGMMFSVFRLGHLTTDSREVIGYDNHKILEFVDGKIIIDLGFKF